MDEIEDLLKRAKSSYHTSGRKGRRHDEEAKLFLLDSIAASLMALTKMEYIKNTVDMTPPVVVSNLIPRIVYRDKHTGIFYNENDIRETEDPDIIRARTASGSWFSLSKSNDLEEIEVDE